MPNAPSDPEIHKAKILARAMWALEWKLQNPGASKETLDACWAVARRQQLKTATQLLADLDKRGFVLMARDPK